MKKITAIAAIGIILFSIAIMIYGCNSQKPDDAEKNEKTTIEGTITSITKNSNGVAHIMIFADGYEKYLVNIPSGLAFAPVLGDSVLVTVNGEVSTSSPNQATAENVAVIREFQGSPLQTSAYSIENIEASNVNQVLNTRHWLFTKISSYGALHEYLSSGGMTNIITENIGSTPIDALTDEFFAKNDLCVFLMNDGGNAETAATGLYLSDGTLFLKIKKSSSDAAVSNKLYSAYLVAVDKNEQIAEGILLTENILSDNLGKIDITSPS